MTALLQAAGLFAGIGYLFSMLATGPIVLATILSIRIGLGIVFKLTNKGVGVTSMGAIAFLFGIMLLYLFQFPELGPGVTSEGNVSVILGIILFCFLYSWIWIRVSTIVMRHIQRKYVS